MACKKTMLHLLIAMAIFLPAIVSATDFVVGDELGWMLGVNYRNWAEDKVFKVGDNLIFNYNAPIHDVVQVGWLRFATCSVPSGSNHLTTGQDVITLSYPGKHWFVCSKGNGLHCDSGMKLFIFVEPNDMAPCESPAPVPALAPFGWQ